MLVVVVLLLSETSKHQSIRTSEHETATVQIQCTLSSTVSLSSIDPTRLRAKMLSIALLLSYMLNVDLVRDQLVARKDRVVFFCRSIHTFYPLPLPFPAASYIKLSASLLFPYSRINQPFSFVSHTPPYSGTRNPSI